MTGSPRRTRDPDRHHRAYPFRGPLSTVRDGFVQRRAPLQCRRASGDSCTALMGASDGDREGAMNAEEVEALVGLAVEEARRRVEARGWHFRVLIEDGVGLPATAD